MKTLYFDCSMGAAGDMLTAALLELLPDPAGFVDRLNALGIPGVEFRAEPSVKCGIRGTHMRVLVHGEEEGSGIKDQGSGDAPHEHAHPHHEAPATGHQPPETNGYHHEHGHEDEDHHHHEHGHEDADHHHHDHHTGLHGIEHLVRDHLTLPEAVRNDVLAVYRLLAEAESRVHGVPVEQIHFHEVGSLDAIADVTAVCLLIRELAPDRILASPVHVGSGQVRCAHGLMPVPAPATAELLKGVPIYGGAIEGELCTPTGAALLRYYVNSFGAMPVMQTEAVGYGMGTKDFPAANCVRALLGEAENGSDGGNTLCAPAAEDAAGGRPASAPTTENASDTVLELACNLDDMTAEEIAFAAERLLEAGALDVWTQAIGMKKSRPGILLSVLCKPTDRDALCSLLFRHTSTLGVREARLRRAVLDRTQVTQETRFGPVRKKISAGFGIQKEKYEYEDLAGIAREYDLSLAEIRAIIAAEAKQKQ